jgi:hypothetical protein
MSRTIFVLRPRLKLTRQFVAATAASSVGLVVVALIASTAGSASAAQAKVDLGTASSFAILAGSTITNTGPSVISGNIGLSPGSSITGFPPGVDINGSRHISDAVARSAKRDLVTAYKDAAGRTTAADVTGKDLGGRTLTPGVYEASTAMALTGTLTLNAQGNSSAVFIFKAGSTLVTASNSRVRFVNGGSACNVFWMVGSSATLGTTTRFIGTILALTSASLTTGAEVRGRVLARNGAVTLHDNVITAPHCAATPPTASPTGAATPHAASASSTPSPSGNPNVRRPHNPRIPKGHPHTGLGGSQGSPDNPLRAIAGLGAVAVAGTCVFRTRRNAKRRG